MKRIVVLAVVAIAVGAALPSQASSQTRSYVAGPGGTVVNPRSEAPGVNGVGFNTATRPLTIKVIDSAALGTILYKVCQPGCGGTPTFRQAYCKASGVAVTLPITLTGGPLQVYVYTEETFGSLWVGSDIACAGSLATTGTVTITL